MRQTDATNPSAATDTVRDATTTTTATALQWSADMIEDYNYAMQPPCAPTAGTFCAVINPNGRTELVTLSDQGELLWLYPDSSQTTGWSQNTTPFLNAVQPGQLCAFYNSLPDGGGSALTVFYNGLMDVPLTGGGSVEMVANAGMQYVDGQWGAVSLSADASVLLANEIPIQCVQVLGPNRSPQFIICGALTSNVDNDYDCPQLFVLGQGAESSTWSVWCQQPAPATAIYGQTAAAWSPDGAQLCFLLTYVQYVGEESVQFIQYFTGGVDVSLSQATLSAVYAPEQIWQFRPNSFDPISLSSSISVPCEASYSVLCWSPLIGNGALQQLVYEANANNFTSTSLTSPTGQPAALITFTAGLGPTGMVVAFGLELDTNLLWMLQQTSQSDAGSFTWVQLGDYGMSIAAPPTMLVPQVVIFDDEADLALLAQNSNGSWFNQIMATPTQPSAPLSSATTYTTELTAVDDNGNPVPGTVLLIYPDTPQTLVVNNVALPAMPDIAGAVPGVTDGYGRVTVAAFATALASPQLTVTISGTSVTNSFRADLQMHRRLANQDPSFPVNEDAYISAGFLPSSVDSTTAFTFCQNMQLLAQGAVSLGTSGDAQAATAKRPAPRGFVLDFRNRGTLTCREMTEAELAARRGRPPADDSVSGLWGDIAHFFKNAWQHVEMIYVTFEDEISIVINDLEAQILTTIDEIRDGIEVVLQALNNLWTEVVDFVKKAIDWLKALFDWQDIINTKNVLKYFFQQNVSNLQTCIANGGLKGWLDTQFGTLENNISGVFGQIETVFGGTSPNSMAPSSSTNPMLAGSPPLQSAPLNQAWAAKSMQINYVTTRATGSLPAASATAGPSAAAQTISIDNIVSAFTAAYPNNAIQTASQSLGEQVKLIQSLSSFLETALDALLIAAEDLIQVAVGAINGLIDAILTVVADALNAALAYLDQPIDIPVISALYQQITGSTLTILDLLCLIVAVPCTILYKLLFYPTTATPPFTSAQVQEFCSTPIIWPWLSEFTQARPEVAAPATDAGLPSFFLEMLPILQALGVVVGLGTAASDIAGDVLNLKQYGTKVPPSETALSIIGWSNVITSLMQTGIYQPWTGSDETTADRLNLACSLFPLLPWCVDVICLMAIEEQAKFIPAVGPALCTALGAVQLGIGISTAVVMHQDGGYDGCDQAAAVLSACSPICKVGTYVALTGPDAATVTGVVMGVLDFTDDVVVPILSLISAAES